MAKKSKAQIEYERARNTYNRQRSRLYHQTGIKLPTPPPTPKQLAKQAGKKKVTAAEYRAAARVLRRQSKEQKAQAAEYKRAIESYKQRVQIKTEEFSATRAARQATIDYVIDASEPAIERFLESLHPGPGSEIIINMIRRAVEESNAAAVAAAIQDAADAGIMVDRQEWYNEKQAMKYLEHFGRFWRQRQNMTAEEWMELEQQYSGYMEGVDFELQ